MSGELKRVSEIVRERVLAARPHPSLVKNLNEIKDLRKVTESPAFFPSGGLTSAVSEL